MEKCINSSNLPCTAIFTMFPKADRVFFFLVKKEIRQASDVTYDLGRPLRVANRKKKRCFVQTFILVMELVYMNSYHESNNSMWTYFFPTCVCKNAARLLKTKRKVIFSSIYSVKRKHVNLAILNIVCFLKMWIWKSQHNLKLIQSTARQKHCGSRRIVFFLICILFLVK